MGAPAWADQRDSRLDDLFDKLKNVESISDAKGVEFVIWNIWVQSGDNAIDLLMRDGVDSMGRQDYKRALRSFDQIVTIAPDFAEGWNKRATLYYLMGQYEQSLADIEKTLALEPRHFGALAGRGLIYIELEDDAQALEAFEDALVINPFLPAARHNAEVLRQRLEDRAI
ncbi:tetratricopeptide repeat protein [Denitrobaculum tricleocarpae]|uniref:Tetratricopeptide repeat protein n=1 Tax=Denitrobaculum tricleocarpae TaxID=2591009 RepID=A0A545TWV3_9PROT|nr:tetratricopeptide repeat protein [Denitrobaculum tricleocarpae]TQV81661.1 tetratricopeptide repeat protein [Denitrobaculum tricleocarpae]